MAGHGEAGKAWPGRARHGAAWQGTARRGRRGTRRKEKEMTATTLFDVPMIGLDDSPRVRRNDPVTSHEAADSNNVPYSHMLVETFLRMYGPLAQHEMWELAGNGRISPSRVRSAFSELELLGKVQRTSETRVTPSGRRAQVWCLA